MDIILRQDLFDLVAIKDIRSIETLVLLLQKRVGSSTSYANLAHDLERDATTVKRWLQLLENLYVIFKVTPYHKNVARSLLKEPKYYFYDYASIDDEGARLENIAACGILKALHYVRDTQGKTVGLHYLRTKEGKEIDFLTVIDDKPSHMIEVQFSNDDLVPAFAHFRKYFSDVEQLQLVRVLRKPKHYPAGVKVLSLVGWLAEINF